MQDLKKRILFVCLGNICRSPAAELICRNLAAAAGVDCVVDSCGTANYHIGSMPDARMRRALAEAGYEYDGHRGRQFTRADFERFDLIIPQDESNKEDILYLSKSPEQAQKVRAMREFFAPEDAARYREVPDPYYGGQEGFNEVVRLLSSSCERLLQKMLDS